LSNKLRYNIDLLNEIVKKNNIVLSDDYTKYSTINRETIIKGNCVSIDCNNQFSKRFESFNNTNGFCDLCIKKNQSEHAKKTMIKICKNKIVANQTITYKYNLESLLIFTKENNIELLEDYFKYDTIRKDTKIHGKCKSDNCCNIFKKGFREMRLNGGAYCVNCTLKNKSKEMIITNNNKSKEEKNKTIEKRNHTFKNNYGVSNPMFVPEIVEKQLKSSFTSKDYTFPSGTIIKCQGYEPFALDKLIKELRVKEDDIITSRINVPEIWYNKATNGKKSRHYVDIFVSSENFCIEVKSTWTPKKIKII